VPCFPITTQVFYYKYDSLNHFFLKKKFCNTLLACFLKNLMLYGWQIFVSAKLDGPDGANSPQSLNLKPHLNYCLLAVYLFLPTLTQGRRGARASGGALQF
jgi:hypothetical protein